MILEVYNRQGYQPDGPGQTEASGTVEDPERRLLPSEKVCEGENYECLHR